MATAAECAKHLDLSNRRFRELLDDGVIRRRPPGGYDLDETRVMYIRALREKAAGRATKNGSGLDLASERALLAKAQTAAQEFRNRIATGEYASIEHVGAAVEAEYSVIREKPLSLPGKLAASLVGRDRSGIEASLTDEVLAALSELSADAVVERTAPSAPQAATAAPPLPSRHHHNAPP